MSNTTQYLIDALLRAGIEDGMSVAEMAGRIEDHLTPKVEVTEQSDGKLEFDITSSVDAGLFCGITTGNSKIGGYVSPDGKQSGLVRFGQCDRLVSDMLGETLLSIIKIEFTRQVQVGDTVRLTIERKSVVENSKMKGLITTSIITGHFPHNGKPVMNPSEVLTYRPLP